jgi:hypothetical protein
MQSSDISAENNTPSSKENSGFANFFSACLDQTSIFLKKALIYVAAFPENPWVKPIANILLSVASAALAYVASKAYQEDKHFSSVYTVVPSMVVAAFSAQAVLMSLFPDPMKKINHYRTIYPVELMYIAPIIMNGIILGRTLPDYNGIKQEWGYYFSTTIFLGSYLAEITTNRLHQLRNRVSNDLHDVSFEYSNLVISQPHEINLTFESIQARSYRYKIGGLFFSALGLSSGYLIRYLHSQQNSIDPLSTFSMFLRHPAYIFLGSLIMDEFVTRFKKYDTNTLQQVSLYLLGPTIQLGNQPYHDIWFLITGAIIKLNQHIANAALIQEKNKNNNINTQLSAFFENKQDIVWQMQSNILNRAKAGVVKERITRIAYNVFFIAAAIYCATFSVPFSKLQLGSAFFLSCSTFSMMTPYLYRWMKKK